ncbi:hypothetical protein Daesc_003105 [Daldinia eschscholtzii]|uniref:Integral membrane protein n=1 Tax=Daldinia eschscholtzii TaxID=292717 RepID=A0AAX6MSG8_9PEZI
MSTMDLVSNLEAALLVTSSIFTIVAAFVVMIVRYARQPLDDNNPVTWLDAITITVSSVLSAGGIISAVQANVRGEEVHLNTDMYAQTLVNAAGLLSKMCVCFSAWPLIKNVTGLNALVIGQVLLLGWVYPLWAFIMPATCGASKWSPLLAAYSDCQNDPGHQILEWIRIGFEAWTPIVLVGFPVAMARSYHKGDPMRKGFMALAIAMVIAGSLMYARVWMTQWFRFDNHYVPEIVITTVSILETNLGIMAANILPIALSFPNQSSPPEQPRHRNMVRSQVPDEGGEWIPLEPIPEAHSTSHWAYISF